MLQAQGVHGLVDCDAHLVAAQEAQVNGVGGRNAPHIAEAAAGKIGLRLIRKFLSFISRLFIDIKLHTSKNF